MARKFGKPEINIKNMETSQQGKETVTCVMAISLADACAP